MLTQIVYDWMNLVSRQKDIKKAILLLDDLSVNKIHFLSYFTHSFRLFLYKSCELPSIEYIHDCIVR